MKELRSLEVTRQALLSEWLTEKDGEQRFGILLRLRHLEKEIDAQRQKIKPIERGQRETSGA